MRRVFLALASIITFIAGVNILSEPSCRSVSFSRVGGRRVGAVSCFSDQSGAVPAWLAAVGLLALAAVCAVIATRGLVISRGSERVRQGSLGESAANRSPVEASDGAHIEVGKQIVAQARRIGVSYRLVHAATQVDALLRNSRDVPSPRAWFFAREPEHLVVMFASDFVRRFQGAHWWSDIKSAHGDGFWGSDGMVQQIRFGGVVYQGVEPQANAMNFVDQMRLHRLLEAPAPVGEDELGRTQTSSESSVDERLLRLKELHLRGLISEEQLRARSDEILREI